MSSNDSGASQKSEKLLTPVPLVPYPSQPQMAQAPSGTKMKRLYCGKCGTLIMYVCGATSVHCSCCDVDNLVMKDNYIAHIPCGYCGVTLMYVYGEKHANCQLCGHVTSTKGYNVRVRFPVQNHSSKVPMMQPSPAPQPIPRTQTVVVENPMTLDESGKLVGNVAIGVTTEKR